MGFCCVVIVISDNRGPKPSKMFSHGSSHGGSVSGRKGMDMYVHRWFSYW